jgi:hypothetical protein
MNVNMCSTRVKDDVEAFDCEIGRSQLRILIVDDAPLGVVNKVCLTLTLNVSSQWRDLIG